MVNKMFVIPMVLMGIKFSGIDLTTEENIFNVRVMYVISQVVVWSINYFILKVIDNKNESKEIIVEVEPSFTEKAQQQQLEAEAKANGVEYNAPSNLQKMTVGEYDKSALHKLMKTSGMGMVIGLLVHWKFSFVQPLLVQSILNPVNLFNHPLFSIHVLNKTEGENLVRPFKEEKPGDMFKKMLEPEEPAQKPKKEKKEKKNKKKKIKKAD